uniref:Uncharacterized protein n=1 Tax=Peronospora matthiolae TaxID=2874970 RepID=A0AAV1VFS7_9STRA
MPSGSAAEGAETRRTIPRRPLLEDRETSIGPPEQAGSKEQCTGRQPIAFVGYDRSGYNRQPGTSAPREARTIERQRNKQRRRLLLATVGRRSFQRTFYFLG